MGSFLLLHVISTIIEAKQKFEYAQLVCFEDETRLLCH